MKLIKTKYTAFMMTILFFLVDSSAFAQGQGGAGNSGKPRLKALIETKYFSQGLTWVLLGWALVKWFDYFNNFDYQNAVPGAIKPAALTFLAFNWLKFATWVGIV